MNKFTSKSEPIWVYDEVCNDAEVKHNIKVIQNTISQISEEKLNTTLSFITDHCKSRVLTSDLASTTIPSTLSPETGTYCINEWTELE